MKSMIVRLGLGLAVALLGACQGGGFGEDQSFVEEFVQLGHPGEAGGEDLSAKPGTSTTKSKVTGLQLVNTETGAILRNLTNGSVIDLVKDGTKLTVQAQVSGTVESVKFVLDGTTAVDNAPPYALAGNDSSGAFNPATLTVGSHTLKTTPYSSDYAGGRAGQSLQLTISVVSAEPPPEDPVDPDPTELAAHQIKVLNKAQAEADLALCGLSATERYVAEAGSAWCSEFARWVYIQAGVMTDSTTALWGLTSWSRFQNFFTNKGKFLSRSQITPTGSTDLLMAGNYLLLDTNLDGVANHSALIVGVSADLKYIYTVEGNVSNCTKRLTRPFWVNGVIDAKILGIGKIWP